jgi:hypothetical protein
MHADTSRFIKAALSAAAVSAAAGVAHELRARNAVPAEQRRNDPVGPFNQEARSLIRGTIQYFIVPVWLAAGLADWWCHKRSRIEATAGTRESLLHLLLLGEAAVPAVLGLFLEITPLLLSAMAAAFFVHEATVMWDVDYAIRRREVTPLEQHVHSVLELAPLGALMLLSLLHWPQFKAVLGLETVAPSTIRLKREPLGRAYVIADLAAMAVFGLLPYVEELRRDLRTRRSDRLPDRRIPGP